MINGSDPDSYQDRNHFHFNCYNAFSLIRIRFFIQKNNTFKAQSLTLPP
jgi:hypothetical protein